MESEASEISESRRSTEETIVAALTDDFTYKIGMCGAGSRTMASRIGEKVKREKLFKTVMMVRIGRPDGAEDRIAHEISDYLGVGLEGGDAVVWASDLLVKQERAALLILDDVWGFVDLERAGIPKDSCKILIVSRFEKVCLVMGCHAIFKLMEEEEEVVEEGEYSKSQMTLVPYRFTQPNFSISRSMQHIGSSASVVLKQNLSFSTVEMVDQSTIIPKRSRKMETNLTFIALLDLSGSAIQELPTELKNLRELRLLDLSNCRNLRIVESGLISSLVRLEELYMLGSFSDWKEAGGGERGDIASIDELERLSKLRALQIQIRDPSIIEESSHIWSRLVSYVVSTPEELECRYQESRSVRFPAVDKHWLQFGGAVLSLHLPRSVTPMVDWVRLMLKSAECLDLIGDGSKPAVDQLMPDGFKLLKRLHIGHCRKMEYLVEGIVLTNNSLFQSLETLSLDDLPLFKEMFNTLYVVELLREIRDPTDAVKLYRRQVEGFCFSSLRSIHISRCPKLRSLFSSSVAGNLRQLEQIRIESCEMMEEIFSDGGEGEGGGGRYPIEFSKLSYLELLDLPRLARFCNNTRVHFPQLREMFFQGLRKSRIFPLENKCDNDDIQSLFPDKAEFYWPKRLDSLTSPSLFSELELLVVASCDTLRQLMTRSIAKLLVKLEQLTVEDCLMMERVITDDDDEESVVDNDSSLFPRLIMVELIGLPSLKSFCDAANDLELPSLEYLALIDCQGMQEFSGGRVSMPVLKYVEKDFSTYRIDDAVLSVQRLFNDKHLFAHNSPSQSQDQEVEAIIDEDHMKEPIPFHPHKISKARTGDVVDNLLNDIEAKSATVVEEEDISDSQDTYLSGEGDAKEETNNGAESEVSINKVPDIKRYLKDFMTFCSVLPRYYEFSKDILVSQWMTGGMIEYGEYKMTEEFCAKCFDALVEMDYFVPSLYDYIFDWMKYKIGDGKEYDSTKMRNTSEVKHMSLAFKELGVLKQYSCLQTLVIIDSYGVDHLPSDIFSELKTLKILNLSGTNVSVLPSSIENLKELRFLDMSKTPILWLPDTICYFSHLHTLNLDGCLELERLPKCMKKLTNLKHLVLDMSRLQSLPIGMGNLLSLQTLNMFSVGVDKGRRVTELKDLNKLRGSFSLLNLENVRSKEEASEACLYKKVGLRKIELHWRDTQDEKCESEEEILESLQPPLITQELKILFYSGGALPSWICNPLFSELVSIVLDECKYCSSLPSLGELPSLKSLSIVENNVLTEIGSSFFRLRANPYRKAFPKLEKLSFDSMLKLEKWTGFEDGDFPSLRFLIVEYCPVFVGLPFLSRLSSLSGLEIRYCAEFSCLPEDGLPASLESLMIKQSPKLKAQCCDEQWRDWAKVALVQSIYIDDQEFTPPKNGEPVPS